MEHKLVMGMEGIFDLIRRESKFCSRCGNKLDLKPTWKWHIPFCQKCRKECIDSVIGKDMKLILKNPIIKSWIDKSNPKEIETNW